MPSGDGYWLRRKPRRLVVIDEHATDAVTRPKVFGTEDLAHLNPVRDREEIVRWVAAKGWIRIRHWRHLGFEFHGDRQGALKLLRWYIDQQEVGDFLPVHIADFESGWVWEGLAKEIPWHSDTDTGCP